MSRIAGIHLAKDKLSVFSASESRGATFFYSPNLSALAEVSTIYESKSNIDWNNPHSEFIKIMEALKEDHVEKISVASFGPFESLDPSKANYGRIARNQPQGLLRGRNIYRDIIKGMKWDLHDEQKVFINTDVNCAAVAEYAKRYSKRHYPFWDIGVAGRDSYIRATTCLVYIVIGHGIGAAQTWGGFRVRDRYNPEMGHIHVQIHPRDQLLYGDCKFHDACVEGFASNRAHKQRRSLMKDDEAQRLREHYISQLIGATHLMFAPNAIVIEGPDPRDQDFLPNVRSEFSKLMGGEQMFYPAWREIGDLDDYISAPICENAQAMGAMYMATEAFRNGLKGEMNR